LQYYCISGDDLAARYRTPSGDRTPDSTPVDATDALAVMVAPERDTFVAVAGYRTRRQPDMLDIPTDTVSLSDTDGYNFVSIVDPAGGRNRSRAYIPVDVTFDTSQPDVPG
jgi:hypothetical protein